MDETLYRRFAGHARLQGGSLFWYRVLDANKRDVGTLELSTIRKRGTVTKTTTFRTLDGREFGDVESFRRDHIKRLRDAEWDAAKPKD